MAGTPDFRFKHRAAGIPGEDPEQDPTRMSNQPALRSSDGTIWVVVAGLFLLVCAFPLSLLTIVEPRSSAPVAWLTAVTIVILYALLVGARFRVPSGTRRLRFMAILMLAMAAVALIGLLICAGIEWSAVGATAAA